MNLQEKREVNDEVMDLVMFTRSWMNNRDFAFRVEEPTNNELVVLRYSYQPLKNRNLSKVWNVCVITIYAFGSVKIQITKSQGKFSTKDIGVNKNTFYDELRLYDLMLVLDAGIKWLQETIYVPVEIEGVTKKGITRPQKSALAGKVDPAGQPKVEIIPEQEREKLTPRETIRPSKLEEDDVDKAIINAQTKGKFKFSK